MRALFKKSNNRGSAIIGVMIAAGMVAILGVAVQEITKAHLQSIKVARVRSFIATVELQLRAELSHPASYQSCDALSGASSCRIRSKVLTKFRLLPVPGTACAHASAGCGLVLMRNNAGTAEAIDFANPYAFGTLNSGREAVDYEFFLRYSGSDAAIMDTPVSVAISYDLLQESQLDCARIDSAKPFFAGFDNNGRAICRPLPNDCLPGEFLNEVDSGTMQTTCNRIQSSDIHCDVTQFVASFSWEKGNVLQSSCVDRRDPFDVFAMGPAVTLPLPTPTPTPTPVMPPPPKPRPPVYFPEEPVDPGPVAPNPPPVVPPPVVVAPPPVVVPPPTVILPPSPPPRTIRSSSPYCWGSGCVGGCGMWESGTIIEYSDGTTERIGVQTGGANDCGA